MNNKIGISFTYWCRDWSGDFSKYARKIADIGYDVMEMSLTDLDKLDKKELDALVGLGKDLGIDYSFTVGLSPDRDLTVPDEATRKRGIEYVKHLLKTAHSLGSTVLGGLSYCAWPPILPEYPFDRRAYIDRAVESVKEVMPLAEDLGITYTFEVVNRFDNFMFTTVDDSLEFIERVGSPNIKMHLDTFHMNIEEDRIGDAIRRAGKHIGYFHLGETDRRPVDGKGRMDWDEFFGALADVGYEGHLIQEPLIKAGGRGGYDLRIWTDRSNGATEEQMDEMAKSSLEYLKAMRAKY